MTYILILQYIGSAFCILSQIQRTLKPSWVYFSFTSSNISAIILALYSFLTYQYGLLFMNLFFIVTNCIAYFTWKNKKP